MMAGLNAHLATGSTTLCRAWAVIRKDGRVFGFTDHDCDLTFDGITFRADTGMTARALQQTTGLSVDNSEAVGALSSAAVTEEDVMAGRFDGADVRAWLVNWVAPSDRMLQFRGALGEIVRSGGAFRAELRGLSDAMNRPQGRAYQRSCSAILGDAACRFDLSQPGYASERPVETVGDQRLLQFAAFPGFAERWFEKGRVVFLTGEAAGVIGLVKNDRTIGSGRILDLWERIGPKIVTGDLIRLEPGCDKSTQTCTAKFANLVNFQGFPHIPGEDWLISYPTSAGVNDGGSLLR